MIRSLVWCLLPAGSLAARVKPTDLLRITNVLRGNRLNYAHCGGEGIQLLKVMQHLALQLPAVYTIRRTNVRRWPVWAKRPTEALREDRLTKKRTNFSEVDEAALFCLNGAKLASVPEVTGT